MPKFRWSFQEAEVICPILFNQPIGWKNDQRKIETVYNEIRDALRSHGFDVPKYKKGFVANEIRLRDWDRCELPGKLLDLVVDFFPDDGSLELFYPNASKTKRRMSTSFKYGYDKVRKDFDLRRRGLINHHLGAPYTQDCRMAIGSRLLTFYDSSFCASSSLPSSVGPIRAPKRRQTSSQNDRHLLDHRTPPRVLSKPLSNPSNFANSVLTSNRHSDRGSAPDSDGPTANEDHHTFDGQIPSTFSSPKTPVQSFHSQLSDPFSPPFSPQFSPPVQRRSSKFFDIVLN